MSKSPSRLGRGLSALIQGPAGESAPAIPPTPESVSVSDGQIRHVPIGQIDRNQNQPRTHFDEAALEELTQSIRQNGLLQPIILRRQDTERFELIAGERRWRAAQRAGLETIPALVRDVSDHEALQLALIENLQREDLSPLERATAYEHYLETYGGTADDLARQLSESRANISNYLRLLKLSPGVRDMLGAGDLAMGQARALAGIADPQRQFALARLVARRNLSVRQVEELVRGDGAGKTDDRPPTDSGKAERPRYVQDVEQNLARATGLRVKLFPGRKKNSGRVVIHYGNLTEFDRIAEKLGGAAHLE